jgi:hypothetical protein
MAPTHTTTDASFDWQVYDVVACIARYTGRAAILSSSMSLSEVCGANSTYGTGGSSTSHPVYLQASSATCCRRSLKSESLGGSYARLLSY